MVKVFHCAPAKVRERISRQGINGTRSREARWGQGPGFFGFLDITEAEWYAHLMATTEPVERFDIWEVEAPGKLVADGGLSSREDPTSAVFCRAPAPPEACRRWTGGTRSPRGL